VPSMRRRTKTMASSTNGYVGRVLGWAAATWPGKPLFFLFQFWIQSRLQIFLIWILLKFTQDIVTTIVVY
jgi:hypothetical protein